MQQFKPEWAVVVRLSLYQALGMAVGLSAIFYVTGTREPVAYVGFSLLVGAAFFVKELLYARDHGMGTVEIDDDEIRVVDRRGERRMRWEDVQRVDPIRHGGWRLVPRSGREKLYVWPDGLRGGAQAETALAYAIGEQLHRHGMLPE